MPHCSKKYYWKWEHFTMLNIPWMYKDNTQYTVLKIIILTHHLLSEGHFQWRVYIRRPRQASLWLPTGSLATDWEINKSFQEVIWFNQFQFKCGLYLDYFHCAREPFLTGNWSRNLCSLQSHQTYTKKAVWQKGNAVKIFWIQRTLFWWTLFRWRK